MRQLNKLIQGSLDLLFPPRCLYCESYLDAEEKVSHLCSSCLDDISTIKSPLCTRCGVGFSSGVGSDHLCGNCIQTQPPYQVARSVVFFTPVARYLLHRLKYHSDTTVVPAIQSIIGGPGQTSIVNVDLVLPVPLHINRLRQRGMNQSLILARLFFPKDHDSIQCGHLVRTRDTVPQTTLNGEKRRKNLRGAFRVEKPAALLDKSVCLVDDVLTTGTTVEECARTLVRAGAKDVKVLTFARAEKG